MKQDENHKNHWLADEGKIIVRKDREESEEIIGSESIWLAPFDTIDNYEEIEKPVENKEDYENSLKGE